MTLRSVENKMYLTKIIIILVLGTLCVNARSVKRQRKIARVLQKASPACGCPLQVRGFLPNTKALLESTLSCLGACEYPISSSCLYASGCSGNCGCQNIFLEELPCGCNYECTCANGYGIINKDVSCDRIPVIRPNTFPCVDAGIPVPAINLPLYQCDVCQCQNVLPYQILDSPCSCKMPYEIMNTYNAPIPIVKLPVESMMLPGFADAPRSIVKPNCGCQMPTVEVCGCQRQKCGCQLIALDTPCSCQLPGSCSCSLSDVSCGCQLPAFNLPCGCQLPCLDCGCQNQVYNSPCSCPLSTPCGCQLPGLDCGCQNQACNLPCSCPLSAPCGCQLPVPNVPYAYELPSSNLPCVYPLPALDVPCGSCGVQITSCGCQSPSCGCQLPMPNVPYTYQLPSSNVPCVYQLPGLDVPCGCQSPSCGYQLPSCGCQSPNCGCQLPSCGCESIPPPDADCTKYLRQVTLQPPFL